ncbi:MAG TPA: c-type cytochrome [Roseiflexaceae bacterium]
MPPQRQTRASVPSRKPPTGTHRLLNQRNVGIGFVVIATLALMIFLVRSNTRSSVAGANGADPTNSAQVALGRDVYATRCATCHGANLEGAPGWPQRQPNGTMPASPLDRRGQAWQHDDQWIFTTIKEGGQATAPAGYVSSMPALGGGMSDDQIWAVIAYVKSTWPADIQAAQPRAGK